MKTIDSFFEIYYASETELTNVSFVFEGQNTEPGFIKIFIDRLREKLYGKMNISFIEKNGEDKGRTSIKELFKIAKDLVNNGGADIVIIVFDLDDYKNDQNRINTLLSKANSKIILAYTNPSFELFVFSLINGAFEKYVFPNKDLILKNEWVINEKNEKERFIYNLLRKTIQFDPKSKKDLSDKNKMKIFENLDLAREFENKINIYLDSAANELTSNIFTVISKLESCCLDKIEYVKKGGAKNGE